MNESIVSVRLKVCKWSSSSVNDEGRFPFDELNSINFIYKSYIKEAAKPRISYVLIEYTSYKRLNVLAAIFEQNILTHTKEWLFHHQKRH